MPRWGLKETYTFPFCVLNICIYKFIPHEQASGDRGKERNSEIQKGTHPDLGDSAIINNSLL